jgi:hypothetical protein
MRVLAASFRDDASARAVRARLLRDFAIDAGQVGVELLAHGYEQRDEVILAGRFDDDVVTAARSILEAFGGTVVLDIDDAGNNA